MGEWLSPAGDHHWASCKELEGGGTAAAGGVDTAG